MSPFLPGIVLWVLPPGVLCGALAAQVVSASAILSGSGDDRAAAVATDSHGNVYVAGSTDSPDFPVTHSLFAQTSEPALRVSADGKVFTALPIPAANVTAVAASNDGRLVLVGTGRGLYRSNDEGSSWAAPAAGPPGRILALAVDPVDSVTAYAVAVTGPNSVSDAEAAWTIYKSADSGDTWRRSADFPPSPAAPLVSRILIHPWNPWIVYAFINSVLLRSDNAGDSWRAIALANPSGFAIAPSQPDTLYATTSVTPLMKSTDGGLTWRPAARVPSAGRHAIAVDPNDPSIVWFAGSDGIERSTDGGESFRRVASAGAGPWRSIAISPADSNTVFASALTGVYATFDGGAVWHAVESGSINDVFATRSRVFLAAAVTPAVYVTKLDPTLKQVVFSALLGPGSVCRIAVDPDGNVVVAGTTRSHAFPTTANALAHDFSSASAGFVAKVRGDGGALLYSTLIDGLEPYGMALAPDGNPVIAGAASGPMPVTSHAIQSAPPGVCNRQRPPWARSVPWTAFHAFAAKLDLAAGRFIYATYLAGSCGDEAHAVAVDAAGNAYIGGITGSFDFPITSGALIPQFPTLGSSGFVAKIAPAGDRLLYSSFIGRGAESAVNAVAFDSTGGLLLAGFIRKLPTDCSVAGRPGSSPCGDAFVMRLIPMPAAPAAVATIAAGCQDLVSGITTDSAGNIWLSGITSSSDLEASLSHELGAPGAAGFVAELDSAAMSLLYRDLSASPGAIAASEAGILYFADSVAAPEKTGAAAFVARIDGARRAPIGAGH